MLRNATETHEKAPYLLLKFGFLRSDSAGHASLQDLLCAVRPDTQHPIHNSDYNNDSHHHH